MKSQYLKPESLLKGRRGYNNSYIYSNPNNQSLTFYHSVIPVGLHSHSGYVHTGPDKFDNGVFV